MKIQGLIAAAVLAFASFAGAQTPTSPLTDKSLHFETGDVAVGSSLAIVHLGTNYRYLEAPDAKKIIVEAWGNPPGEADDVLGLIVSGTQSPLDDDAWGIVVTHVDDGHIDDADAAGIDYSEMLTNLKKGAEEANADRKKAGYDTMHLVGWAQNPSYDSGNKKLIWAKEYSTDRSREHTLNYDVRVLGRTGAISLNAVGGTSQLKELDRVMVDVAKRTEFVAGQRYADFKPGSDKMAAYGVAGLIAGGIAAKAGLFKGLLIALIALKKFVIIGVVALFAAVKKIFGGGKSAATAAPTSSPPPPPTA